MDSFPTSEIYARLVGIVGRVKHNDLIICAHHRLNSAEEALKKSAGGTGIALIYSAVTSILGFSIMAFAPMPMFAAYGFLTATMIFLALIASLLVLPPLLLLVTPVKTQGRR